MAPVYEKFLLRLKDSYYLYYTMSNGMFDIY